MAQLIKKIKVTTSIELLTGLHIGGNSDNVEIGGLDNPVIKIATKDKQPYIPGSSLKGKMRCLLEQIAGTSEVGGGMNLNNHKQKIINNLFGYSQTNQPSKLIVRDAYLSNESVLKLLENDNLDMPYTEAKWENVIHRVKGIAEHPRQSERVPAGVSFDVQFIINIWSYTDKEKADGQVDDEEEQLIILLEEGIAALENDYLGGSGSRGYGQIKFDKLIFEHICFDKYLA